MEGGVGENERKKVLRFDDLLDGLNFSSSVLVFLIDFGVGSIDRCSNSVRRVVHVLFPTFDLLLRFFDRFTDFMVD